MNYQEAIKKSKEFGLNEWDFKTTNGFMFAVEFFEKERLEKERKIKTDKYYKEWSNGHNFTYDRKCNNCGIDKTKYSDIIRKHKVSCSEVLYLIKRFNCTVEEIEKDLIVL